MWDELSKGVAPAKGVGGVGHSSKIRKMVRALAAGMWDLDREFLTRAQSMCIHRDERKGRLLLRFTAAQGDLTSRSGTLGQTQGGMGAVNICTGTKRIFERFSSPGLKDPKLDLAFYTKLLGLVEATNVDSAGDELLACKMAARGSDGVFARMFPNHKMIIRDTTHASRKIGERPLEADPFIKHVTDTFLHKRGSIAQMLQHSTEIRRAFDEEVKRFGGTVKNMKAAKHRHESWSTPAARLVVHSDAVNAVAMQIVLTRKSSDDGAVRANNYLANLTEESFLQLGMVADYSNDCLMLTRWLDDETVETADLQVEVASFAKTVKVLYQEGGCINIGFTKTAIQQLGEMRLLKLKDGEIKSLGGPGHPSGEVLTRCLHRMKAVSKLALETVRTEFPDFDDLMNFKVLAMSRGRKRCDEDKVDVRAFEKLAKAFDVDATELVSQFKAVRPVARQSFKDSNCTTKEAWRLAVKKLLTSRSVRNDMSALLPVLVRHATFGASTAGVEQEFSGFKRLFGEQRLNASEELENDVLKLVQDRNRHEEDPNAIYVLGALDLGIGTTFRFCLPRHPLAIRAAGPA